MRTRWLIGCATLGALALLPACAGDEPSDDGRITIDNDKDTLSTHVDDRDDEIDVEAGGASNALVYRPEVHWELTLIAEVAPPTIDGELLQATSVAFEGDVAVVSYNMAGAPQRGAIDVFTFDAARQPTLTSRAVFDDTDVHAVAVGAGRVYLATGTADERFGTPAVLEALSVDAEGQLNLDDHVRLGLSSYAATSVAISGGTVYATSGDAGDLHTFDAATLEPRGSIALDDARWVATDGSNVVVVQGTPGRLAVVSSAPLEATAEYPFEGAQIPESKSTVQLLGGKAFVAGGPGGAFVFDVATGDELGHIPVPEGLPLPVSEVVTNAVSADGELLFVSNGAAGVYLVEASRDLSEPLGEAPLDLAVVGRLVFPGDIASVNHITYKDGFLFVATGRGGLKIVRVDHTTPTADPPTGYPYETDFDSPVGQAGWTFSGDWALGVEDGDRTPHSGRVFIDNDPSLADQYNHGAADNVALLDVPLTIPAADPEADPGALSTTGVPLVEFWYSQALLHSNDAVYVEVEDPEDDRWEIVSTLKQKLDRPGGALHEVWLNGYVGKTVRLRLRQRMSDAHGPRRFSVDDLRVGPLTLPTLPYPYVTSHEQDAQRARWNLEGAWGWTTADTFEGSWALSANPDRRALGGFNSGQLATMRGWIPVPAEGAPACGFWFHSSLASDSDRIKLQIQRRGEARWRDLVTLIKKANHAAWTYREVSLGSYAGERVRLRWVISFANSDGDRDFVVDDLRVGEVDGPTLPYPYVNTFDTAEALGGWALAGSWGTTSAAHSGGAALDANPARIPQPSYGGDHYAMMTGFVPLPEGEAIALTYRFQSELVHPSDRVLVDVQTKDDGRWRRVMAYTPALNRAEWSEQEARLDAYAGRSVRLRLSISLANTLDTRAFRVDDVRIGGLPELRLGYPYRASFDGAELSDDTWALTGSWELVDADFGGALDLNPQALPLARQSSGHVAQMRGFVDIPDSGRPTLTVALRFSLTDPHDRIYVEVQDAAGGSWSRLRTYDWKVNHPTLGWDEIPLSLYKGQAIRVRLRYSFGAGTEARVCQVDDVRFGPLILDNYAYPWATSFESAVEQRQWNLWGAWTMSTAHGAWAPASGQAFLDGNAAEAVQNRFEALQTATLNGYISLPADEAAWLSFSHRFDAVHPSDRLYVEAQRSDSDAWTRLATLDQRHARGEYARLEIPLSAFAGDAIRLRFRQSLGASDEVRVVTIDDVAVGPLPDPRLSYPYLADFSDTSAAREAWSLHGDAWRLTDDGWLDANPDGLDQAAYSSYQTATLDGFVELPADATPVASFDYTLDLVDKGDRVTLEAQRAGEASWTRLYTLTRELNAAQLTTVQAPLTAFAGAAVRFRFRLSLPNVSAVRAVAIGQLRVGEAP